MPAQLFPAMLKYWRGRRGLSQLQLALAAGVSSRHVSFLESGRARPSEPMVLRLLATLQVPLRDQNEVLVGAGFGSRFSDGPLGAIAPAVDAAVVRMLEQQEPYPLLVLGPRYEILRMNRGARALFSAFVAEPARLEGALDMVSMVFDPALLRTAFADWPTIAQTMLARLQRDALSGNEHRATAVERALQYPDVPQGWRQPDFSRPAEPSFTFRLRKGRLNVGFLNTITVFSAPQHVTLEELVIESSFPLDDETRATCARL